MPRARGVLVAWVTVAAFVSLSPAAPARRGRSKAPTAPSAAYCHGQGWIGAWAASPSDALASYTDQSLRLLVTPTYGGQQIRVHLSNRLGEKPVRFSAVTVARETSGASVADGSVVGVRFAGQPAITIAAGQDAVSDPVALTFVAFTTLAVSVHVDGDSGPATEHYQSDQSSYVAPTGSGDHTADESGSAFTRKIITRPFVTGIDVMAPHTIGTLVTLGDSITDGTRSTVDAAARYPDDLARRLAAAPAGTAHLAVANAGIGGNRITRDFPIRFGGAAALSRLTTDVIDTPGVTDVLVLEGTNDITPTKFGYAALNAASVIAGLSQIVTRLHAAKLNVILGTLTPSTNSEVGDYRMPQTIVIRNAINGWIRTQRIADGMVDFNAALRDPADHDRLRRSYASADNVHPTDSGYRAMARAVPLGLFRGPACGRR